MGLILFHNSEQLIAYQAEQATSSNRLIYNCIFHLSPITPPYFHYSSEEINPIFYTKASYRRILNTQSINLLRSASLTTIQHIVLVPYWFPVPRILFKIHYRQ